MYFNVRVVAALGVIAAPAMAGNCAQSVVMQASENKFLEFVIRNCATSALGATLNMEGTDLLDPETCLSTFISDHNPGDNPIDLTSRCGGDFLQLVTSVSQADGVAHATLDASAAGYEGCKLVDGELMVSYVCFNRLSSALQNFADDFGAGYPVYANACTPQFIRSQNRSEFYKSAVEAFAAAATPATFAPVDWTALAPGAEGVDHMVPAQFAKVGGVYTAASSLKDAMCYGCAAQFMDDLQSATLTAGVIDSCSTDANSPACLNSRTIANLKKDFATCTGFSFDFNGPLCTQTNMDDLKANLKNPTSWEYYVMCGVLPTEYPEQCTTEVIDNFDASVNEKVGTACGSCLIELKDAVAAAKDDAAVKRACTKTTLTSTECKAALADVALAFKSCAGYELDTMASSSSNSAGGSTSNGGSDSNADDGSTTTSSVNVVTSLVGVVAAVALSSML